MLLKMFFAARQAMLSRQTCIFLAVKTNPNIFTTAVPWCRPQKACKEVHAGDRPAGTSSTVEIVSACERGLRYALIYAHGVVYPQFCRSAPSVLSQPH